MGFLSSSSLAVVVEVVDAVRRRFGLRYMISSFSSDKDWEYRGHLLSS